MSGDDLAFTPAWKQAELVAHGEVSPVELVELYLRRIERLDPRLRAYITVCWDAAIEDARRSEAAVAAGGELAPLHGVPVSLKDLELTRGIRTTLGSPALRDYVPDRDSVVAERVRRSGAIIVGKTNTPEIGISFATVTENAIAGRCLNPWDTSRSTGSSSGGAAAAIAAGMCAAATGSDGGGSIRIPASFCGVFGMKPTQGRVPRAGGYGRPEPNQFAQSGPITHTVRDAAILLRELSGPDLRDPSPYLREPPPDFAADLDSGVTGLRIGWSSTFGYGAVDPEVDRVAREAAAVFESLGCRVDEADISLPDGLAEHFWTVYTANVYAAYGELLDSRPSELGDDGRRALEQGRQVSGAEYAQALRAVQELRLMMDTVMERFDLLLTPTTGITAFEFANRPETVGGTSVDPVTGHYPCTFPANMTGQPAASLPCGFIDGLPVGLHVIGGRGEDACVLRACASFEQARPWSHVRPELAPKGS